MKSILSHPNTLTLFRIATIPIIVVLMMYPGRISCLVAAILFSAAAITDYFDGYLARRFGLVSNLGKVMDPVADKLLVVKEEQHAPARTQHQKQRIQPVVTGPRVQLGWIGACHGKGAAAGHDIGQC